METIEIHEHEKKVNCECNERSVSNSVFGDDIYKISDP